MMLIYVNFISKLHNLPKPASMQQTQCNLTAIKVHKFQHSLINYVYLIHSSSKLPFKSLSDGTSPNILASKAILQVHNVKCLTNETLVLCISWSFVYAHHGIRFYSDLFLSFLLQHDTGFFICYGIFYPFCTWMFPAQVSSFVYLNIELPTAFVPLNLSR